MMITRIRRVLSRIRRDDGGFGLIEFSVAMVIFSVLAVLIITAFTSFTTALTKDRIATSNTDTAAIGMNELTRVIRSATSIPVVNNASDLPAFSYANKEKIILYAYIDTSSATPKPVKIQFEVNGNRELIETRWAAHPKPGYPTYWEFDTAVQSTRVIARKIVAPVGAELPMFLYYSIGIDLQPVLMTQPSGGIAAANLEKIAVVKVTVKVQTDTTGRAKPVTITNQVGIPNLGISRLGLS